MAPAVVAVGGADSDAAVTVLPQDALAPFHYSQIRKRCFDGGREELARLQTMVSSGRTLAVHLYNKMSRGAVPRPGSPCEWLLSNFALYTTERLVDVVAAATDEAAGAATNAPSSATP